ncbi:MAG: hypothetical protein GKR96_01150 [Gammaproteobacteria bacterium]|nr:hypothetical protein [Gammaproteobacteria bacterium]
MLLTYPLLPDGLATYRQCTSEPTALGRHGERGVIAIIVVRHHEAHQLGRGLIPFTFNPTFDWHAVRFLRGGEDN